jgi:hypothetical protein
MHNYFLIENNYSQSVNYSFKSELKFWKDYSVVKIIIVMIVIITIITITIISNLSFNSVITYL